MIIRPLKRKNSEKVLEELVLKERNSLYKLAYMYVKNSSDAMDILQEAITKAYKNIDSLKDLELMDRWVKRIISNCAIDHIKKGSRIIYIEDIQMAEPSCEDNKYEDLYEAVDMLPLELKSIIILKYFQGYTIEETSGILELSSSQVKNKLHKALQLLRLEIKMTS